MPNPAESASVTPERAANAARPLQLLVALSLIGPALLFAYVAIGELDAAVRAQMRADGLVVSGEPGGTD